MKLGGSHVVLKGNLFSYSVQVITTDTLLLFFRQVMLHANPRKVLEWDASATCRPGMHRYLNFSCWLNLTSGILVVE